MPSDVAHRQCAIECVRQGVHADIGIGMSDQSCIMVDPNAAQPDVVARSEGVNVIAVAKANIHATPKDAFGPREIGGIGDFQIVFGSRRDVHRMPGQLRQFDIVGGPFGMGAMGGKETVTAVIPPSVRTADSSPSHREPRISCPMIRTGKRMSLSGRRA